MGIGKQFEDARNVGYADVDREGTLAGLKRTEDNGVVLSPVQNVGRPTGGEGDFIDLTKQTPLGASAGTTAGSAGGNFYPETQKVFLFVLKDKNGNDMLMNSGEPIPILVFQSDTGNQANPTSRETPFKKMITREPTRAGWVEWHGGDELDTMTVSGTTGAFYDQEKGLISISEGRFQTNQRTFIENLLGIYRNNGVYTDRRGVPFKLGKVVCMYDLFVYEGFFETLTVTETADKPYSMTYSFTFTIERTEMNIPAPSAKNYSVVDNTPYK